MDRTALDDAQAVEALRELEAQGVASGPCGAATLAGLYEALSTEERRANLRLTSSSVVVLISTEGPGVFVGGNTTASV